MTASAPRAAMRVRTALLSYPRSAIRRLKGPSAAMSEGAWAMSEALPGVSRITLGRPFSSTAAWSLLVRPPRDWPMAWLKAPLLRQLPSGAP